MLTYADSKSDSEKFKAGKEKREAAVENRVLVQQVN
jgi:hypothetical protein